MQVTGAVTYNIVMSGVIREGFELETVAEAFAGLFKISPDRANSMVGTRRIIKKGSSSELAETVKNKLWDIGLEVVLEGAENKVVQPKEPPPKEFTDTQITQITEVATKDQVEGARLSIFGSMVCPHCRLRQTKAKKCTGCGESVLKAVAKKFLGSGTVLRMSRFGSQKQGALPEVENPSVSGREPQVHCLFLWQPGYPK